MIVAAGSERCPVCPFAGLRDADLTCPSCGTDLRSLRRVQELPLALLNDALRLLEDGDPEGASKAAAAAAAFDRVRPDALLALGDALALLGDLGGAGREWRAADEAGAGDAARVRLSWLLVEGRATSSHGHATCPNPVCPDHGREDGRSIVLVRLYGHARTSLWRCRSCGTTFSSTHDGLLFRSRLPAERAYVALAELLAGRSVRQAAAAAGCSPGTVRRLAARARSLGPQVADEVAGGLGRSQPALRRQWSAFAAEKQPG